LSKRSKCLSQTRKSKKHRSKEVEKSRRQLKNLRVSIRRHPNDLSLKRKSLLNRLFLNRLRHLSSQLFGRSKKK
jgi:hypothetical protein